MFIFIFALPSTIAFSETTSGAYGEDNYVFGVLHATQGDLEAAGEFFVKAVDNGRGHPFADASLSTLNYYASDVISRLSAKNTLVNLYIVRAKSCTTQDYPPSLTGETTVDEGISSWKRARCESLSLYLRKRYKEAKDAIDAALAVKPDDTASLVIRGMSLIALKEYENALEDLTKAARTGEEPALVHHAMGIAYLKSDLYEKSEKCLTLTMSLGRALPETYDLRGLARLYQGKTKEAIRDFKTASRLNPRWVEPIFHAGFARYLMREYDEAIRILDRVIEMDRSRADAYFQRALCRFHMGDYEGFTADIMNAIRLNPKIYYED